MKFLEKLNYSNYYPDHINYLEIAKNKIFFEDKSIAFVVRIDQLYDEMLSDNQIVRACDDLKKLLNSAKTDEKIQFYYKKHDYFQDIIEDHKAQNQSNSKLVSKIIDKRVEKLNKDISQNNLLRHKLYMIVKVPCEFELDHMRSFLFSPNKLKNKVNEKLKKIEKDISKRERRYISNLENIEHLDFSIPDRQELVDLISSHMNQKIKRNVEYKAKNSLIDCDLGKKKNALYINDKYVKIITLKQHHEPSEVWATLSKRLTNAKLSFNYELVINLQKLDKEEVKSKLKWRKKGAQAKAKDFTGDADFDAVKSSQDIENLQKDMTSNEENLFKFEMFIVVKADSLEELNKNCDTVIASMKKMGATGFVESFGNINLFWDTAPGNSIKFNKSKEFEFRTSYLVHLLPMYGPIEGYKEPTVILRNRHKGLTYFNPVSDQYKAKNGLVAAGTGGGKSFWIIFKILSILVYNPMIIIVDKGGSFKKLIETLGGEYFQMSSEYSINPFDINLKGEDKELFWENILKVMVRDEKGLSTYSKTIIEKAVRKVIDLGIEKPIISDFVEQVKNLEIPDVPKLQEAKSEVWIFLDRWTEGPKGRFLNNRENDFDPSNDIMSIDLKGLEKQPELLEVFMYYISAVIWDKAEKNRDRKKLFIFDEVWSIFATKQGQELMDELYRTMRKYNGALDSISQNITDFAGNEYAKGILVNTDFKYLLEQGDVKYSELQDILNLKDYEIKQIKSLKTIPGKHAELFCKNPDGAFISRVVSCPFEYWLGTTHGPDVKLYEDHLDKFQGDILKTFEYLAEEYPSGVFS